MWTCDCDMHHFQNLGKRKLKDELGEKTPNMVAVLLGSQKPWIACHYPDLAKGCDMEDISKPQIEIVDFRLKCCIAAGVSKVSLSGRIPHCGFVIQGV